MKLFKSHTYDATFIKQLLDVINPNFVRSTTKKYSSDYRCKDFDTYSHFYTMMYLQLNNSKSLRCCITELENDIDIDSNIYVPSLSQLSRKNASRDFRVFEDIFFYLLRKLKKKLGVKKFNNQFRQIKAFDSTVIEIASKLAPDLNHQNSCSGMKMSTLLNLTEDVPEKVNIVRARVNDRKCIGGFFDSKEDLYLFDRGYYDYKWYDNLTENHYKFITRQVSNASVEELISIDTGIEDLYDSYITLGTNYSKNKTKFMYREILTFDEKGKEVRFLTNVFDISAKEVADFYRMIWQIELFFKWIKQNLRVKHWLGHNENAIKIQLYTALISFLLVRLIQDETGTKDSALKISRIIRIYITKKVNLMSVFKT